MKRTAKHILPITVIATIIAGEAKAQLMIDTSTDPVDLVENILVGQCVSVSNISYNGVPQPATMPMGIGAFGNGSTTNLGIDAGVILSTGDVFEAANAESFFASSNNGTGSDPDLALLADNNINDRAVLEFDFIPTGDSISFKFVFASEEYPSFECSSFNDAFGFFLSGPGISGPFSNSAINLALIPGTTVPIAINTVNSGTDADPSGYCQDADPNWQANSIYFVDNDGGATITYGGFTTVLTAKAGVVCNETYHIKLAIGDAGDSSYDSAVFLEAGSFESAPVVPTIEPGPSVVGNTIYKSCLPLDLVLQRVTCDINTTEVVQFSYSGTAVMGTDLIPAFPDSIVFAPGDTAAVIPFVAPLNGQGQQNLIIDVQTIDCQGVLASESFEFFLEDPLPFQASGADHNIQCGDEVVLVPDYTNGFPPFTVEWSTGETADSLTVAPTEFTSYTATITDTCGAVTSALFNVGLIELPPLLMNLIGSNTLVEGCETNQINIIRPQGVPGDLDVVISSMGDAQNGSDFNLPSTVTIPDGNFNVLLPFDPIDDGADEGSETVMVIATFTDDCGRTVDAAVNITIVDAPPILISGEDLFVACDQADSVLVAVTATGGYDDQLTITWGDGSIMGEAFWTPVIFTTSFTATATDPCGRTASTTINVVVDCEIIIPNVFSPNNDGMNDLWHIEGIQYTTNTVKVYNRWGQVVHEAKNYRNNWRGQGLPDGTYFYEIIVDRHDEPYVGHVTILRGN